MRYWLIAAAFCLLCVAPVQAHQPNSGTIPVTEPKSPTSIRIAFFGNSITAHDPDPTIGWYWYHGMAATQPDQDYVHQVQLGMAAALGVVPEIEIVSGDINRHWDASDVDGRTMDMDTTVAEFDPTIVVVAMGDNATLDTPSADWLRIYRQIVAWTPGARTRIAVGLWATPSDVREQIVQQVAAETGMIYVPISDLHVVGVTDGTPSNFLHGGVRWHPGNEGMRLIAQRILAVLIQKTYLPVIVQ